MIIILNVFTTNVNRTVKIKDEKHIKVLNYIFDNQYLHNIPISMKTIDRF